MSWDYRKFPRHPVAAENSQTRGRNTILLHYLFRVEPKLGKSVCDIFRIKYACPAYVSQLDKYC